MSSTPEILITNDDGIHAPGLAALKHALAPLGRITTVAPDAERSASGHSITMLQTLRAVEVHCDGEVLGLAVNGTPADCVKLAISNLLSRKPDLVVSGINPGPNTGTNVLYSGTVSAAMEGVICGVPAMAVSMGDLSHEHDFSAAEDYARRIAERVLQRGLPPGVLLNVNVPTLPLAKVKGIRVTRQAIFRYHDKYERRQDPRGRDYFWLSLEDAEVLNPSPDMDDVVLDQGYVSITPLHNDMTAEPLLDSLGAWFEAG